MATVAMTMVRQILLCALLATTALGGTDSEEVKSKPYYAFRNDCNGEHSVDEHEGGSSKTTSSDIAPAGYSAYPGDNNERRQRALIAGVERDIYGGSKGGKSGGSAYHLFSKCSKSDGSTGSKSSKTGSKSSKSKSSKSKSSKSSPKAGFHVYPPSTPTGPTAEYKPYTGAPAQAPADAPSATEEVSSCEALAQGDPVTTSNYAKLEYTYEAAVSQDADINSVSENLDKSLTLFVGDELMGCDERRRLLGQPQSRRFLAGLEIVGVKQDSPQLDEESCSYFMGTNEIDGTNCYVVNSGMWLYFQGGGGDEWRRRLTPSEDEAFMEESTAEALGVIMAAMNEEDPSPFVEASDSKYSVSGLMGVRYISGTTFAGETIEDQGDRGQIDGIQDGGQPIVKSSRMSAAGVSLLTIGLVALLALTVMLVVRKRRQSAGERYTSFDDDAEKDLDDVTVTSSMPPTPRVKSAYIVGEEGSIYTSATHDTRVLYNSSEFGNGNDENQQVDVHHCTSAMCPICNGKETVFVSAIDEHDENTEVQVEEYEMGYDPTAHRRSFEYELKENVSNPSFDNPSEIERPYVVDDTIDF